MKISPTPTTRSWLYNTLRTLASHYGHTAVDHTHLFSQPHPGSAKTSASVSENGPVAVETCACCGAA